MEQVTIQIIAVVVAITALLGWVVRTVLIYFMTRLTEKDKQIIILIEQQQKNTDAFVGTINHQQSKWTASVDKLTKSIDTQTEVFKQLIKK